MSKRIYYIIAIIILIIVGLLSRKVSFLPTETGDGLWAVTLFCALRALFINTRLGRIVLFTIGISYVVELSQMLRWEWLVAFRSTTIGHLLLGQGFLLEDLLAYTIGVTIAYIIAKNCEG